MSSLIPCTPLKINRKLKAFTCLLASLFLLTASKTNGQLYNSPQTENEFELVLHPSPEEKLFIHLAKSFYLPGEIIWFKLYVTDAYVNRPLSLSKVAYTELLDSANKPVLQAKITLDSSTGNGSLVVPAYLPTGKYVLRAYTNLMKNYDPGYYFHQAITIINPAKTTGSLQPMAAANYTAGFFPEGGQLVSGLPNNVAFKVQDQSGIGINATGVVIDQYNDTIVRFQTRKFGMSHFRFIPSPGNKYRAMIRYPDNKVTTYPILDILDKGYTIQLNESGFSQLSIDIQTNTDPEPQFVYLVAHARQKISISIAIQTTGGRASFLINKKDLPEGVSCFTVFNKNKEAVAERLYFIRPANNLNLSINMERNEFATRSKIESKITASDQSGKPVSADISMAAWLLDSFEAKTSSDIRSYLWLGSDIKGIIESPEYYFNSTGPEVAEVTDNLLLTQGWRKLNPAATANRATLYIPEYAGHIITGRITDKRTGAAAKGIVAYLSVPGERFHFSSCRSDEKGRILFDCKKIVGTENIIVQTNKESDNEYRIEIDNPFSGNYMSSMAPPLVISEKWKEPLLSRVTGSQLLNAFTHTQAQQFFLPNFSDTTPFFGKPDNTYLLDDYTRFYTMEEVMREYVPEVQVRKSQSVFRYRMLNLPYKRFFESNPLVLLDGVPVFDINKIIAFDPLKVKRLDIIARKYLQGAVSFDGIASYSTYEGDLAGFVLDPNALIIEYAGLQLQRQFYSPVYETSEDRKSRLPDFRNVLYWEPAIKTNKDGNNIVSFFSSDVPGRYAIQLQGITPSGQAGSQVFYFTVKR